MSGGQRLGDSGWNVIFALSHQKINIVYPYMYAYYIFNKITPPPGQAEATLLCYLGNKAIYTNRGRCHRRRSWWLAPLIFHLILYICFYDLPANRNTQLESRSVMVDCAIGDAASCTFVPCPTPANFSFVFVLAVLVGWLLFKGVIAPRDSHYLQFWLFTSFSVVFFLLPFYALLMYCLGSGMKCCEGGDTIP